LNYFMHQVSKMCRYSVPFLQSIQHMMPKQEEVSEKIDSGLGLKPTIYDEDYDKEEKLTFDMATGEAKEVNSEGEEIKFENSDISDSASEPEHGGEKGCDIVEVDSVDEYLDKTMEWAD
jgi:hypothetical protein